MGVPTLRSIATSNVVTLSDTATLADAVQAMNRHNIRDVVVRTASGYRLVLSSMVLSCQVRGLPLSTPLSDLELPEAALIRPDATTLDGLKAIRNHSEHVCLVDQAGELQGIVSYTDLAGSLDPQVLAEMQSLGELLHGIQPLVVPESLPLQDGGAAHGSGPFRRQYHHPRDATGRHPHPARSAAAARAEPDWQAPVSDIHDRTAAHPRRGGDHRRGVGLLPPPSHQARGGGGSRRQTLGLFSQRDLVSLYYNRWFVILKEYQQQREDLNRELQEQERKFRTLFEYSPDAIVVIDPTDGATVNSTAGRMSSSATAPRNSRVCPARLRGQENPRRDRAHVQKIITEGHDEFETLHRHKDGHLLHILVSAVSVELNQQPA